MSTTGKEVAIIETAKQRFKMVGRFLEKFIPYRYTNREFVLVVTLVAAFAVIETVLLFAAASHGTLPTEISTARQNFSDAAAARLGWGVVFLAIWPAIRLFKHKAIAGGVTLLVVVLVVFLGTSFWFKLAAYNDYAPGVWKVAGIGPFLPLVGLVALAVLIFWIGTAGTREKKSSNVVDVKLTTLQNEAVKQNTLLEVNKATVMSAEANEATAKTALATATTATKECADARDVFEKADTTVPDAKAAEVKARDDRDAQTIVLDGLMGDLKFKGSVARVVKHLDDISTQQVEVSDRLAITPSDKSLLAKKRTLELSFTTYEGLRSAFEELDGFEKALTAAEQATKDAIERLKTSSFAVAHEKAKTDEASAKTALETAEAASAKARAEESSQTTKATATQDAVKERENQLASDKAALDNHNESNRVDAGAWWFVATVFGVVAVTLNPIWQGYALLN